MRVATKLGEEYHLPGNRKHISKHSKIPPYEKIYMPTIKTHLIDETVSKDTEPNILKAIALETIESYPRSLIQAYTDGSAFKACVNAGFGAVIKFPDGRSIELEAPCGSFCSNYEAECSALLSTLNYIEEDFDHGRSEPLDIVIFSDSKSALDSLEDNSDVSEETVDKVKAISRL